MDKRKPLLAAPTVKIADRSSGQAEQAELYSSLSIPDMYIGWHSFRTNVVFLKTKPKKLISKLRDEVYKLQQGNFDLTFSEIKNRDEDSGDPTLSPNKETLHRTFQIIKKTKLVGFRDRILFEIFPNNDESIVAQIYSRSIDQNFYTALCGCSPINAYYACCCGFCPTYDFEMNKKFVYSLLAAIDESYVFANDAEVEAAKRDAYKPPSLQSRNSFAWNVDTDDAGNHQPGDISRNREGRTMPASAMTQRTPFSLEDFSRTASNSPSHGYVKLESQAESNKYSVDENESNVKRQLGPQLQEHVQEDDDSAESGGSWYEL